MPRDRSKYPSNKVWYKVIRPRILARDGYCCTKCGVPDHAVGYRDEAGKFCPAQGYGPNDAAGQGLSWPSLARLTFKEAAEIRDERNIWSLEEADSSWFVVLLSMAHRDHDLVDHDDDNLTMLCQQCHIRYDKHISAPKAGFTRRYGRGTAALAL